MRRSVASLALLAALAGCVRPAPTPVATPHANASAPGSAMTAPSGPGPVIVSGTVSRVVDGDTAEVRDAVGTVLDIRIFGIDTPEVYGGAQCWGREASDLAKATLAGQPVTVYADPTQDAKDRYGRTLGYVVRADGLNWSIFAAQQGAARRYVYRKPVALDAQIAAAERQARDAKRGLWGPPCNGVTS